MSFFDWLSEDDSVLQVQKREQQIALRELLNEAKAKERRLYCLSERLAWETRATEKEWDKQRQIVAELQEHLRTL